MKWLLQFTFSDQFHNPFLFFQHLLLTWIVIVYSLNYKKNGNETMNLILWWIVIPMWRSINDKLLMWNLLCPLCSRLMLRSYIIFWFKQNLQYMSYDKILIDWVKSGRTVLESIILALGHGPRAKYFSVRPNPTQSIIT